MRSRKNKETKEKEKVIQKVTIALEQRKRKRGKLDEEKVVEKKKQKMQKLFC